VVRGALRSAGFRVHMWWERTHWKEAPQPVVGGAAWVKGVPWLVLLGALVLLAPWVMAAALQGPLAMVGAWLAPLVLQGP
jgi:hypothetical protein